MPELMKEHCATAKNGLPVPYVVYEENGIHHFKINDHTKTLNCIKNNLCAICGTHLADDKWLISGPASAFHKHGSFNDLPMHKNCAVYALKVCPYLAFSRYNSKMDFEKIQKQFSHMLLMNSTVDNDRVPLFALTKISNYILDLRSTLLKPIKPYLEIEFWNDGERMEDNVAKEIIKQYFITKYKIEDLEL